MPDWRTIFEVEPCLPLSWFTGHAAGGEMLTDGADHLLVIIGTYSIDSWSARPSFDPAAHLGKLLRITIETGETETLAIGFRNSQGLARDAEGNVWATDHGPQGGDELNLLDRGGNYGWPLASYGVDYGGKVPLNSEYEAMGRHDGFLRPAFAWVPSPAVSAIAVNDKRWFPLWKDDLLVASLRAGSLFRVRRHGTDVQYVERIEIGWRIRDLTFMPDGRIALLRDSGWVYFLSRSRRYCNEDAQKQRKVYSVNCESITASAYEAVVSSEPVIRSDFDLYLNENTLTYTREPCAHTDTEAMFFLHLIPAEVNDLPDDRRQYGFDNLDFNFDAVGAKFDGKCLAEVPSAGIRYLRNQNRPSSPARAGGSGRAASMSSRRMTGTPRGERRDRNGAGGRRHLWSGPRFHWTLDWGGLSPEGGVHEEAQDGARSFFLAAEGRGGASAASRRGPRPFVSGTEGNPEHAVGVADGLSLGGTSGFEDPPVRWSGGGSSESEGRWSVT